MSGSKTAALQQQIAEIKQITIQFQSIETFKLKYDYKQFSNYAFTDQNPKAKINKRTFKIIHSSSIPVFQA